MSNVTGVKTPEPGRIRALALDLDGTILRPGAVLGEPTVRILTTLGERGIQLIIATGRAVEAAERFRQPLGARGPMIYFNGAVVADMPEGRVLEATLLDPAAAEFCLDLSRRTGTYFQAFFPGTEEHPGNLLMAEREGPERDMYFNHTGLLAEIGDLKDTLRRPGLPGCIKAMFLAEPEVQDALRPELEARFGGGIYLARTLRTFLEIMNPQVSKGEALRRVMKYRGLSPGEVIALGDEENDLPMFAAAGFSAAPRSAKETVKTAANLITGPNAEDGPARWLAEFFKID